MAGENENEGAVNTLLLVIIFFVMLAVAVGVLLYNYIGKFG
jgi:hypothetical protein